MNFTEDILTYHSRKCTDTMRISVSINYLNANILKKTWHDFMINWAWLSLMHCCHIKWHLSSLLFFKPLNIQPCNCNPNNRRTVRPQFNPNSNPGQVGFKRLKTNEFISSIPCCVLYTCSATHGWKFTS